jgi:hypothetical protein
MREEEKIVVVFFFSFLCNYACFSQQKSSPNSLCRAWVVALSEQRKASKREEKKEIYLNTPHHTNSDRRKKNAS